MELDLQSCARLLSTINSNQSLPHGKQLHLVFLKRGILNSALTIANRLLQMYTKCGQITDARNLFDEMSERNCFTWNTMIEGYMKWGKINNSLDLFRLMPNKNEFSWNVVILGLVKAEELSVARRLLHEMPSKNEKVWNSLIHGYAKTGFPGMALRLFKEFIDWDLREMDSFVLATALGACADARSVDLGKQIHARIIVDEVEIDSVLASSLVNMYGKGGDLDSASYILSRMQNPDNFSLSALISAYSNCGRMDDARRIFNLVTDPCIVLWNSMIAGYVVCDKVLEALLLFEEMHREGVIGDSSTLASVLNACASAHAVKNCLQVHVYGFKLGLLDDLFVASALIDTYAKCGCPDEASKVFNELKIHDTVLLNSMITIYFNCNRIEDARQLFELMPYKSLISWNSMIIGLNQNGCPVEALDIFYRMNRMDFRMDKFSFSSVISACASIASVELGEQIFARAVIIGIDCDQIISTSLIDFYCKCGFVTDARKLFDQMIKSDEVSWNSMLMGCATNGHGNEALNLFHEMRGVGVSPTNITFIGVLSACDHCGLLEEGKKWFYSMSNDYHIDPGIEHYSCMVDLYARAGCLEEAMNLIEKMPFEADSSMWLSILRGCVAHGNKILGELVAHRIIELDPENSGAFVQLSNVFATSEDWERSASVRRLMIEKKIHKSSARSWSDI
ncbi:putative pentatricopeptide repeat-containing protein At1g77010, mitochondrial [Lycium ferocissimum]|uniref:putative pentatricopeptide repeat-containing protein At1g77010, mitochondrial n=1 Tax=Lycium ferocissimum TaxID=112874 RepID=UPI002815FC23|nr:putative pentatricopeptide repeat-containing protein At1g77010, mitochondrial [Lycium ferocissimum]XP_059279765.1 putative pentatricopeptide repeat-containing protein At1g77010, mitochondrial [Lycium ferocissimum]